MDLLVFLEPSQSHALIQTNLPTINAGFLKAPLPNICETLTLIKNNPATWQNPPRAFTSVLTLPCFGNFGLVAQIGKPVLSDTGKC